MSIYQKKIKQCLAKAPTMASHDYQRSLMLYISATQSTIRGMLAQEDENNHEMAVYYFSRFLSPKECRYFEKEKLGPALFYIVTKLRYYISRSTVFMVARSIVIKYLLGGTLLTRRLSKWNLSLSPVDLQYVP